MSNSDTTQKKIAPHLIVRFVLDTSGKEAYSFGLTGGVPMVQLIGYIGRVQTELLLGMGGGSCEEPHLLIEWNAELGTFSWVVGPCKSVDGLNGMLELIRFRLTMMTIAQEEAQKPQILGPNGLPLMRN